MNSLQVFFSSYKPFLLSSGHIGLTFEGVMTYGWKSGFLKLDGSLFMWKHARSMNRLPPWRTNCLGGLVTNKLIIALEIWAWLEEEGSAQRGEKESNLRKKETRARRLATRLRDWLRDSEKKPDLEVGSPWKTLKLWPVPKECSEVVPPGQVGTFGDGHVIDLRCLILTRTFLFPVPDILDVTSFSIFSCGKVGVPD